MATIDEVNDEILNEQFCLAFELDTLSRIVTQNQLERWLPGFSYNYTEAEHYARYSWACQFVTGKTVLDIACGTGRGSYIMAEQGNAKEVMGCDIDERAIKYASIRNRHEHVSFFTKNAETFSNEKKFDVIVSFETIEHLPSVESFLERVRESLNNTGCFIVSTPISQKDYNEKPDNSYHLREWGFNRFQKEILKFFSIDKIYVQLYPPKASIMEKVMNLLLKKIGTKRQASIDIEEALTPVIWDERVFPINQFGKKNIGYQILVCNKRTV